MKIVFISDLHGFTPTIPSCDICCFVGDYQRCDTRWENESYFLSLRSKCVTIGVAGNHDEHLERDPSLGRKMFTHYLVDTSVEVNGLKFFGTPYTLLDGWPFGKREEELEEIYNRKYYEFVTDGFPDIVLSHQPAYGILDLTPWNSFGPPDNIGSRSLLNLIELVEPSLHIAGHNHSGYGCNKTVRHYDKGVIDNEDNRDTLHMNVAYCDDNYKPRKQIVLYNTETGNVELVPTN